MITEKGTCSVMGTRERVQLKRDPLALSLSLYTYARSTKQVLNASFPFIAYHSTYLFFICSYTYLLAICLFSCGILHNLVDQYDNGNNTNHLGYGYGKASSHTG